MTHPISHADTGRRPGLSELPLRALLSVVGFGDAILRRVRSRKNLFRRTPRIASIRGMTEQNFADYARRTGIEAQLARVLADAGGRRAETHSDRGLQGGEEGP